MRDFFRGWRQKAGCFLLATIAVLFATAGRSPRSALPYSAEDIHESKTSYVGFTMDSFYMLKAKMTESEFLEFARRMGLTPLDAPNSWTEKYNWGGYDTNRNGWWNPTDGMIGVYHDNTATGSQVVLAKYENGYLYFKESAGY